MKNSWIHGLLPIVLLAKMTGQERFAILDSSGY